MATIDIVLANGDKAGETLKQLTNQAAALRKELSGLKPGTDEFVQSAASLNAVETKMGGIKEQIKSTSAASSELKGQFGGILNQIPGFSQISGALNSAKGSVGGLTSGFGLLKGAIAATGIGLLVVAVASLVKWFSDTEKGANVLAGAMAGLKAVVNVLFGQMMKFVDFLTGAFKDPKKALMDLVDFIGDNIMNRFKAFGVAFEAISKIMKGDFKDGFKQLTDSAIQFSTGITDGTDKLAAFGKEIANAASEAYDFVQAMDDIEDRQAAMEITAKKNEILVDQLLLQAKNVSKTYDERVESLNKADAITRQSYEAQLALSKEYLDAVNKEIDAEKKQQGVQDDTDEMRDKRKDAELAYLNLKGQQIELEEKIANRREQILAKQDKADEKAAAELAKRLAEEEKQRQAFYDEEDKIRDIQNQAREDSRDKDLEQVKLNLQKQIEALDTNSPLYAEHLTAAQELARKQRDDVNVKWDKKELDEKKKAADEQKKIDDATKSMQKEKMALEQDVFAQTISLLGTDEAARKKNADAIKGFTIAQMTVSLENEIQGIWENAEKNPLNAILPGSANIIAAIKTALAIARFGSGVSKVTSQKFALGGLVLRGASHAQGGIPIEAEGDEIIMTKGVFRNPSLRNMASAINVAGGGISFQTGGPVNPYDNSRGPMPSGNVPSSQQGSDLFDYNKLAAALAGHVEQKIRLIKVQNVVTETVDAMKTINTIQNDANI